MKAIELINILSLFPEDSEVGFNVSDNWFYLAKIQEEYYICCDEDEIEYTAEHGNINLILE